MLNKKKIIFNIAHRGASAYKSENTIESFKKAIELGSDIVEFDVQKTIDNKIIVLHNKRFKTGKSVAKITYSEVKEKLLKKGIKVPLLNEVIKTINNRIVINIEIKGKNMVDLLVSVLKDYDTKNIIVSSFSHENLFELKKKMPKINVGVLLIKQRDDCLQLLDSLGTDLVIQKFRFVDRNYIEFLHHNKKKIWVWTLNRPLSIKKAIFLNVDGIFTNYPDRVKIAISS